MAFTDGVGSDGDEVFILRNGIEIHRVSVANLEKSTEALRALILDLPEGCRDIAGTFAIVVSQVKGWLPVHNVL